MKLYVMPGACSLASHIALIWAKADFELVILSHEDAGGVDFRKINAKSAVPALVLEDGTVITESLAILGYIADVFPEARLGAGAVDPIARAKLNELLAQLVSDVHKAWAPVFVPGRFVMQESQWETARQAAFGQIDLQYARLDSAMQDRQWALFDHRTVADAYLYVMCSWKDKSPTPLAAFPALAAFKARLDGDPGVQRALQEEGLT